MTKVIGFDTESYYDNEVSVKPLGAWKYARHPLCDAYMISVCDGETSWAGEPRHFNFDSLRGNILVSHNAAHDMEIYAANVEKGLWPKVEYKEWHCTANLSSYICNRRSLADASEFLLGKPVSKVMRNYMKGKSWADAIADGKAEQLLEYARVDAELCREIWMKYGDQWPDWERRLSQLTIEQGRRGVLIHRDRLEAGLELMQRVVLESTDKLPWMQRGDKKAKAASRPRIVEECRREGIPPPPIKAHDPEDAEEWEIEWSPKLPWVKALKDLRKAKKAVATLETMKLRLRDDGTMAFSLKYFGAHCVSGEHEVLTRAGWVKIRDWRGTEIVQLSPDGLGFFEAFPNRFVADDEKLLWCKSGQVSFQVTEGHWCLLRNKKGDLIKQQAAVARNHRVKMVISGPRKTQSRSALSDEAIRFRVAVQADGHYMKDCRSIRFRLVKPRKIERLRELATRLNLKFVEHTYPSEPHVRVFTFPQFPAWLEGAKQFNLSLLEYSAEQTAVFLDEIWRWDGEHSGSDCQVYYTCNQENALWVQTMAHLGGMAAVVSVRKRQGDWNPAFRVTIRNAQTSEVKSAHWSEEKAEAGEVFCPTAKWGNFLTRYDGCICVTGNTGRWSGDGGINFQNFARDPLFVDPAGWTIVDDLSRIEELVKGFKENPDEPLLPCLDMRGLLLPPKGKLLGSVDSAQIEPRVLNYTAGNIKLLKKIAEGFPIYEAHARDSMGWTGGKLKTESPKLYSLAKARCLGLGYGCGWEKFIMVAKILANIDITEEDVTVALRQSLDGKIYATESKYLPKEDSWEFSEVPCEPYYFVSNPRRPRASGQYTPQIKLTVRGANSRDIVKNYRDTNPLVVQFWRQMQERLENAANSGEDLVVELPSGRKLTYRRVKYEFRTVKNKETGLPEKKTVITAEADGVRKIYHGALIVENITQAIARDVFAHNTLVILDAGIDVLWTVHDEDVCAVNSPEEGEKARQLMATVPEWLRGCPLDAELVLSDRYKK